MKNNNYKKVKGKNVKLNFESIKPNKIIFY